MPFRMGRLDHVHIRVPDRAEAARWYSEHLGFEQVLGLSADFPIPDDIAVPISVNAGVPVVLDAGVGTTSEDLWRFCRRALGA